MSSEEGSGGGGALDFFRSRAHEKRPRPDFLPAEAGVVVLTVSWDSERVWLTLGRDLEVRAFSGSP